MNEAINLAPPLSTTKIYRSTVFHRIQGDFDTGLYETAAAVFASLPSIDTVQTMAAVLVGENPDILNAHQIYRNFQSEQERDEWASCVIGIEDDPSYAVNSMKVFMEFKTWTSKRRIKIFRGGVSTCWQILLDFGEGSQNAASSIIDGLFRNKEKKLISVKTLLSTELEYWHQQDESGEPSEVFDEHERVEAYLDRSNFRRENYKWQYTHQREGESTGNS